MVHFTQYCSCVLYIQTFRWCINAPDYSIRKSGGKRICAPDPGLSQLITSFFAWQLPGIRHRPVFAWPYHLFRSILTHRSCVLQFSTKLQYRHSLQAFISMIWLKISHIIFRPSFVISKNVASVTKILKQVQDDVASDTSLTCQRKK